MRLIALAVLAVAVVLGAQIAAGGGDFTPRPPAAPCVEASRAAPPPESLEPLAERIVLVGLAEAACDLGLSRERLVLRIGTGEDVDAEALRAGLDRAVDGLDDLPRVSGLLDEALELTDLPGIAQDALGAVPGVIVDQLLPTDDLLQRAIADLDVEAVLGDLDDPEAALRDALLGALREQVVESLKDLIP